MREKLSKLTGMLKFGSALKSAKGGILAASKIGLVSSYLMASREDIVLPINGEFAELHRSISQ